MSNSVRAATTIKMRSTVQSAAQIDQPLRYRIGDLERDRPVPVLNRAVAQYLRAPVHYRRPQVATRPVQPVPSLAHGGERILHNLLGDSPRAHQ